jgi:hypothetical protein
MNTSDEVHLNMLLTELNKLIYSDIQVKFFKNKHFTGITVYLITSLLCFHGKYSEMKVEKM